MADGVTYRSLHPIQVLDDQTEGPLGSMSHAERQVFEPRPFCKWWCQEGPVDNCCFCFPLRTGIVLLSLNNLVGAVVNPFVGSITASNIALLEAKYAQTCSEGGNSTECETFLKTQAEYEFLLSCAPLLNVLGVVLLIFSVIGFRAACTGDSKFAKLYMKAYPIQIVTHVVLMVLRVTMAPSTITTMVQVNFCVAVLITAYYCKVTWSFYKRRKIMEDMQLACDTSSLGHFPMVQAPAVV